MMTEPTPPNTAGIGNRSARDWEKFYWGVLTICAALLVVDLVFEKKAEIGTDAYFGFYAAFGFLGCVAAALCPKAFSKLVQRGDDFYEPTDHEKRDS
jgi:hypothetical protein